MKNQWLLFSLTLFTLLIFDLIEARPSRGGGGGRAGGASRGSARASQFPAASAQAGQRSVQPRNLNVNNTQVRNQVQQRMQTGQNQALGQRRETYQQFQTQNLPRAQDTRQALNNIQTNHPGYRNWFNDQFYQRHDYTPNIPNLNWWRTPNWNALNGWVAGTWSTPMYYSYLDEGIAQPYAIEGVPAQSPATSYPTTQGASVDQTSHDWIPLGVFAAAKGVSQAPYSNMFVQLALNKDGQISGAYYNAATEQLHPLEGVLSKQTQVVAWTVADNPSSPLMQTGLYNLTQDETPIQMTFADDSTQTWFLVRLHDPAN